MKSIRVLLVMILIGFSFIFVSCKEEEEKKDLKVEFIKGDKAENAVITGADNPAQAVDVVYAKINAQKYLGGSIVGFASATLKQSNEESVVVSVLCLDRPGDGINVSGPLVSVLSEDSGRWTFIRTPDEIGQKDNLPESISDKETRLNATTAGKQLISRSLPGECGDSSPGN